jgi:hypothetical protein
MGTTLTGLTPATTYDALIKVGDNGPITGALKVLSDGLGTNLPMEASTTAINFTGTLTQGGTTLQPTLVSGTNIKTVNSTTLLGSGDIAVQPTLVSGTNIKTLNSVSLLGSGDIVVGATPSGVAGAIQFSNGSAFASDATNLFWDDTNNRLGVGTNTPTATTHIKGSGSTSATTSLLVQNSAGSNIMTTTDDRSTGIYAKTQFCFSLDGTANNNLALRILTTSQAGAFTYIDAICEGSAKALNYPIVIGSRLNNIGSSLTDVGTQENGTPVIFGSAVNFASSLVTINSTTRGFLPPRMTTTQKNAIATPAAGLMVYDTTLNKLCVRTAAAWETITSV